MDKEKGFSVYFFEDDNPSDFCIIDQESDYSKQRLYMNVGAVILVIAVMLATPVTLVGVYDTFHKKVEGNKMYFVWSIVTVSSVATGLMIVIDVKTVLINITLYPKNKADPGYHDIYIYFILSSAALGVIVLGDTIVTIVALVYVKPVGDRKFPIPELFKFIKFLLSCCGCCRSCEGRGRAQADRRPENQPLLVEEGGNQENAVQGGEVAVVQGNAGAQRLRVQQLCCSECLVLLLGSVFFTLFLQLTSFHSVYILLGTIGTPVQTLSITSFYIATYFCLVAFIAVVLKSTDKQEYYSLKDFKLSNLIKCLVILTSAGLFITCAVFFVIYFYNYTVMVQGYHNSGGIFGIVGSLLPSLLVVFGGWCGTKLIKCIKPPNNEPQTTIRSTSTPPPATPPNNEPPPNQPLPPATPPNNEPPLATPPNIEPPLVTPPN